MGKAAAQLDTVHCACCRSHAAALVLDINELSFCPHSLRLADRERRQHAPLLERWFFHWQAQTVAPSASQQSAEACDTIISSLQKQRQKYARAKAPFGELTWAQRGRQLADAVRPRWHRCQPASNLQSDSGRTEPPFVLATGSLCKAVDRARFMKPSEPCAVESSASYRAPATHLSIKLRQQSLLLPIVSHGPADLTEVTATMEPILKGAYNRAVQARKATTLVVSWLAAAPGRFAKFLQLPRREQMAYMRHLWELTKKEAHHYWVWVWPAFASNACKTL